MTFTRTRTSDMSLHHLFMLIVGPVGCGKTYTLGTLPEEKTVILSMESGLLTLSEKDFEVWTITSMVELREAYLELTGNEQYNNVGVDSLTELSEILFTSLRPQYTKAQNFNLYEDYNRQMLMIVKSFRDMNKINTFVTCLTKDGDNGHTLDVAQKSLGTRLPQYFDFVAYMQKFEENEKVQRALLFDSSDLNFCKSRSVKIEKYEKPNLGDIINKVFKES